MVAGGLSTIRRRVGRFGPVLPVGLLALTVWLALVWIDAGPDGYLYTGDSNILVAGTHEMFHCFKFRQFTECGLEAGGRNSVVGSFAPLQYIPSTILLGVFHVTDISALRLLARINTVAFVGTIVLAGLPFRRNRAVWPIAIVAVAFSAAAFHATSAFGEMLAAFAVLGAAVAALERRPVLLGFASFFASLSKETIPPFLLLLVLAAAHEEGTGWRPNTRILIASASGCAMGLLVMASMNVFRFGSVVNKLYFDPRFRTPGIGRQIDFAAGLWLSPSSGIAAFWPIATLLIGTAFLIAIHRFRRRRLAGPHWAPLAIVIAVGSAFVASLSSWYAPFGWVTYGPRLAAPILPAFVVVACKRAEPELSAALRRLSGHRVLTLSAALVVAIVAAPQATAPWSYSGAMRSLMAADATCPNMSESTLAETDAYYRCVHHYMWRTRPSALWSAVADRSGVGTLGQVMGILAATTLTYGAFTRTPGRREDPDPSPSDEVVVVAAQT